MDKPESPFTGQGPFPQSPPDRKVMELIHRLQAQNAALIAVLKETPAGDGRTILDHGRWERYDAFMDVELRRYDLE